MVTARFLLACTDGHLDDFPYAHFVHHGSSCPSTENPTLNMTDYGANLGANVTITCTNCSTSRNIHAAMGPKTEQHLPRCRGRHPHVGTFTPCEAPVKVLVVGSSNQWFSQNRTVLSVPETGATALQTTVAELWENLTDVLVPEVLDAFWKLPAFAALKKLV